MTNTCIFFLLLQRVGSRPRGLKVIVVHGLSCPESYGIFLDQGLNPCPLPWQAYSYPLYHQGSPVFFLLIGVQFIYNVVSAVQQSESVIHISILSQDYFPTQVVTEYRVPCAIQQDPVGYLFHIQQYVYAHPNLLIYPSCHHFPFSNQKFGSTICESVSVL